MASAHEQWMAALSKVQMLGDEKLQGELLNKLQTADKLIDEENSSSDIRVGLQMVREVHAKIRETANL